MFVQTNTTIDTVAEESQTDAVSRRAKGEFVRGVSGFRNILTFLPNQAVPPLCSAQLPAVPQGDACKEHSGPARQYLHGCRISQNV